MKSFVGGAVCAIVFCAAGSAGASSLNAVNLLTSFNVIVIGDYDNKQHVDGPVYVGGKYTSVQSSNINMHNLPAATLGGLTGTFFVGGDVDTVHGDPETVKVNGGAFIGGSVTGGATPQPNAVKSTGGVVTTGAAGIASGADVGAALVELSDYLAGLTNSGGSVNVLDGTKLSFTSVAGADGLAVINLPNGADLLNAASELNGVAAASDVITVINVGGDSIIWNANANGAALSNVVFNFYQATSITINSRFNAHILAPLAELTLNGGGIDGHVAAMTLIQNSSEIHWQSAFPTLPSLPPVSGVPLPASAFLLMAGAGMLGGLRLRRKRAA